MADKSATGITRRREQIERMMLQGMSPSQILEAWNKKYKKDPLAKRTLERDLSEIRKRWREDGKIRKDRDELIEQAVRKSQMVESTAWKTFDSAKTAAEKAGLLRVILDAHGRQAELQGLDAPKRVELTGAEGGPIESSMTVLTPKERRARIDELVSRRGTGASKAP
jgi:hypothetical protein